MSLTQGQISGKIRVRIWGFKKVYYNIFNTFMNSSEKPIPISRGQEISAGKLIDTIKEKLAKLEELHSRTIQQIKDKQVLYNREFMRPEDKRNYALIAALSKEIKELEEIEAGIFDSILEGNELLQEGKERLRDIKDLTAEMNEFIALENTLKSQTEK